MSRLTLPLALLCLLCLLCGPLPALAKAKRPAPRPPPVAPLTQRCREWGQLAAAFAHSRDLGVPPTVLLAVVQRPGTAPALEAALAELLRVVYRGDGTPRQTRQAFETGCLWPQTGTSRPPVDLRY